MCVWGRGWVCVGLPSPPPSPAPRVVGVWETPFLREMCGVGVCPPTPSLHRGCLCVRTPLAMGGGCVCSGRGWVGAGPLAASPWGGWMGGAAPPSHACAGPAEGSVGVGLFFPPTPPAEAWGSHGGLISSFCLPPPLMPCLGDRVGWGPHCGGSPVCLSPCKFGCAGHVGANSTAYEGSLSFQGTPIHFRGMTPFSAVLEPHVALVRVGDRIL